MRWGEIYKQRFRRFENYKKEFLNTAKEINKFFGQKVINIEKILKDWFQATPYQKIKPKTKRMLRAQANWLKMKIDRVKKYIIKPLRELKAKVQKLKKELEITKPEVEKLKKEFIKTAEKFNKLCGAKVIDINKILSAITPKKPLAPYQQLLYYKSLKHELEKSIKTVKEKEKEVQKNSEKIKPLKLEVEKLKKEFIKEAEELNKLYGKEVIDVAKILPPPIPATLSIVEQIKHYKNLKNELIKSIKIIKEKKREIIRSRKTLEELKKETEIRKKRVSELVNKLSTLTGKKPVDISELTLPEPKTFPEKLAYYQKLNEQLSQIEQVLRKELEKVLEKRKIPAVAKEVPIVKEDVFKSIIPILPIAVLGGLILLQSSQKASK